MSSPRHTLGAPEPAGAVARGLAQWPVAGALGLLHLVGLLVAFVLAGPLPELTLGSKVAVAQLLGFLVLLEVMLVAGAIALVEPLASTPRRRAAVDLTKAMALAALFTVLAASLLKYTLTGVHIALLDVWFLVTNLVQLASESLPTEIGIAILLAAVFAGLSVALYRAFAHFRRRPHPIRLRSYLLLSILAIAGTAIPLSRSPEIRLTAQRIAPELGWLLGATADAPAGFDQMIVSSGEITLAGPPFAPYRPDTPISPANVVLIMLESVPASALESAEAARAMPNLLGLAEESLVFSRAYAPSAHSDYAQMAILSSLHPRKYRAHDFYKQLEYPRALIWDALAPAGWETGMFSCQNEGWGNMIDYLSTPGLQTLLHSPDWPTAPRKGPSAESKVFEATVVGAWQDWLDGRDDSPWFAYLNFQANHFPYEIPRQAERPFAPHEIDFPATFFGYPEEKVPVMRNRFFNALHYSDRYIGEVMRVLEERGEWERTALIVVADHGEAFYEHGQPTHGTQLFEEQIRTFVLARLPRVAPRAVDEPVALLDVAPSLLTYLGLPPHGNFQGRSDIFDSAYSARDRPLFFTIQGLTDEDGVLVDDWKYIASWRTGGRELYHVASDPYERDNLASKEPQRVERLHLMLSDYLNRQLAYYAQRGWERELYPEALP